MKCMLLALLWLCLPAAAFPPAGSVYQRTDAQCICLSDDGSGPAAVLIAEASAGEPGLPARIQPEPRSRASPATAVDAAVLTASRRYGVSAALIRAVIGAESGFRERAVSPRGAVGLMQLMPGTARSYGVADTFDVAANVDAGTRHLRGLIERFGSDLTLVLAAYNAGADAVVRFGHRVPPYAETMAYVPRVLRRLAALGGSELDGAGILSAASPSDPTRP